MNKKAYFKQKGDTTLTRISKASHSAIKALAVSRGLKQVTILEYILRGKININELNYGSDNSKSRR